MNTQYDIKKDAQDRDHFNNDEAPPYKLSENGNKLNSSLLYKLEVVTMKTEAVNKLTNTEPED